MAKPTYSKKPLTGEQKDAIIEKGNEDVAKFLEERVQQILKSMENNKDGEQLIWNSPVFQVRYSNPASGVSYNTENSLILSILSDRENFEDPFFLTAKQGYDVGLSNKGEKSNYIVHRFGMKFGLITEKNELTGKMEPKKDENGNFQEIFKRACKLTPVFNIAQFTGELPEKFKKIMESNMPKIPTPEEVETVFQAVLETMPTGLKRHVSADSKHNYYSPAIDLITLAPSKMFKSRMHELSTLLHEVSHSYGHESRKNRESLAKYSDDIKYRSYEELVANLSAQAVIKHFNFAISGDFKADLDKSFFENHQNYDAGWAILGLKKTPMDIFKASSDADRTANEIIFKIEENLKLKYQNDSKLEISDFIKERLVAKVDNDEEKAHNKENKSKIKPKI
jgi:antirestriction protein ArdC